MTAKIMDAPDSLGKPIVFAADGKALANSRDVAAWFGKAHRGVLRPIRSLLAAKPGLDRTSFVQMESADARGRGQPSYDMDRDGFTLLAMGFTGAKALEFKIAYIEAFNRMEAALSRPHEAGEAITVPERREFPDWPLDEWRAKKETANLYRMVYGPLSAQWIMPKLGFPRAAQTARAFWRPAQPAARRLSAQQGRRPSRGVVNLKFLLAVKHR